MCSLYVSNYHVIIACLWIKHGRSVYAKVYRAETPFVGVEFDTCICWVFDRVLHSYEQSLWREHACCVSLWQGKSDKVLHLWSIIRRTLDMTPSPPVLFACTILSVPRATRGIKRYHFWSPCMTVRRRLSALWHPNRIKCWSILTLWSPDIPSDNFKLSSICTYKYESGFF